MAKERGRPKQTRRRTFKEDLERERELKLHLKMQKRWPVTVLDGDNWLTDVPEAAQEELRV